MPPTLFNNLHIDSHRRVLKDGALDPHLVAGVLQLTLKDMPQSLLCTIYSDMMANGLIQIFKINCFSFTPCYQGQILQIFQEIRVMS